MTQSAIDGRGRSELRYSVWRAMAEDAAGVGFELTPELVKRLRRDRGRRLPSSLTVTATSIFGPEVDDVRLHTGTWVDDALAKFNAQACCVGRRILLDDSVFPDNQLATSILFHELAHIAGGVRHDVLRCWDASEHASLSAAACMAYAPLLEAFANAVDLPFASFLRGVMNASSNMDFRGRVARAGQTILYLQGALKGEGVAHGEALNYHEKLSMKVNELINVAEQNKHARLAVTEILKDKPIIEIGKYRVRFRSHRSGNLGKTIGGASIMERGWVKSLANALHVAQDRASHREGTAGYGHDDPRCPDWSPDKKVHEHSKGKDWTRCSMAAYNKGYNNSLDVVNTFIKGVKERTRGKYIIPTPARKVTRCG